jgi:release factor glutamine methyltransferase
MLFVLALPLTLRPQRAHQHWFCSRNRQLTTDNSLRDTITRATTQFAASPRLRADAPRDALVLLLHATNLTRAAYHANPDLPLTPDQASTFDALVRRRLTNEPIQYITGEQEFYSLTLHVTPAVLIPRPETELLVEAVLTELKQSQLDAAPLRILDIGTGSGAIAIALAHHLPHAHITATDISPAALAVANANATRHHLTSRIRFLQSDLLDNLTARDSREAAVTRAARPEQYEVLISNPPYVPTTDRPTLQPQVRDFEPATALFAGPDGLEVYRRLIPQARAALKPNGLLALELGHNQRDALADLLADWHSLRFLNDLQQIPRIALARKP